VLLPTACVLWLINDAIHNQRSVVRQKLADAYLSQLSLIREQLDTQWAARSAELDALPGNASAFAQMVNLGLVDSAVILDGKGAPVYPAPVRLPETDANFTQPEWVRARQLEKLDLTAAASVYITLGQAATEPGTAARAIQAAARCLAQAGQQERAARLVVEYFGRPGVRAMDRQSRPIAASALLMAIRYLKPSDPGDRQPRAVCMIYWSTTTIPA